MILFMRSRLIVVKDTILQLLCIKPFLETVEVDTVLYRETSCLGTTESSQESTAIEGSTDITGQRTDISTLAADNTDACSFLLIIIVGQLYLTPP